MAAVDMKPPPEPPRDIKPSTAVWMVATGIGLALVGNLLYYACIAFAAQNAGAPMTAMIIGMLPVALGLGEGGEQNAPLGRAVIGGLAAATFATLFLVPVAFRLLHRLRDSVHA